MVERPHIFACAKCGTVFGSQSATDALAAAERRGEARGLREAMKLAAASRSFGSQHTAVSAISARLAEIEKENGNG